MQKAAFPLEKLVEAAARRTAAGRTRRNTPASSRAGRATRPRPARAGPRSRGSASARRADPARAGRPRRRAAAAPRAAGRFPRRRPATGRCAGSPWRATKNSSAGTNSCGRRQQRPVRVAAEQLEARAWRRARTPGPPRRRRRAAPSVQRAPRQVVEEGRHRLEEQRQVVLDARRRDAGRDVLVEALLRRVALEQLAPAAAEARAPGLVERELARRQHADFLHRVERALRVDVEGLDRVDHVVVEVEAVGQRAAGRERDRSARRGSRTRPARPPASRAGSRRRPAAACRPSSDELLAGFEEEGAAGEVGRRAQAHQRGRRRHRRRRRIRRAGCGTASRAARRPGPGAARTGRRAASPSPAAGRRAAAARTRRSPRAGAARRARWRSPPRAACPRARGAPGRARPPSRRAGCSACEREANRDASTEKACNYIVLNFKNFTFVSLFALIPAAGSGTRLSQAAARSNTRRSPASRCCGTPCEQFACRRSRRCSWCSRRATRRSPARTGARSTGKLEPLYCGGETRRDSVYNGLVAAMAAVDADDWVLVHDAARPCLPKKDLDSLIAECKADEIGGILALPVADTVKRAAKDEAGTQRIAATEDRAQLWLAQTPQMFRAGLLAQALRAAKGAVDRRGERGRAARPQAAPGGRQPREPEGDLAGGPRASPRRSCEAARMRIGQGLDVHAFAAGRKLVIGGVEIPHAQGPRRPLRRRRAAARDLRRAARRRRRWATSASTIPTARRSTPTSTAASCCATWRRSSKALKLKVVNVDATIIAEAPRMAPHIPRMIGNIAADLGVAPAAINIKATTTEQPRLRRPRRGHRRAWPSR